jgi:transposase
MRGYNFDEVREPVQAFGVTAHLRSRGEEARAIKREAGFKARRWVVERTHSWMNRFRRILIRWEKGGYVPRDGASDPGHHHLADYRPIGIGPYLSSSARL